MFQIYEAQSTVLLKLTTAAAVCSFVGDIPYLIVSTVTNKIKELLIFCCVVNRILVSYIYFFILPISKT